MSLRDRVLGTSDLARAVVDVPEWGGPVTIRVLTYAERARWYRATEEQEAAREALGRALRRGEPQTLADPPQADTEPESIYSGVAATMEAEGRISARLVRLAVIDPDTGEQEFTDDDLPALAGRSPEVLVRLAAAISTLSALNPENEQRAEKNSGATPNGSHSSDSASLSDAPPPSSPTS